MAAHAQKPRTKLHMRAADATDPHAPADHLRPSSHLEPRAPTSPQSLAPEMQNRSQALCESASGASSRPVSRTPSADIIDRSRFNAAIDVIRRQFDLEILLKHRELTCIEDEIAKVHIMMVQLRRCAGKTLTVNEPDEFARHYAQYLLPDRRYSEGAQPDHSKPDGASPSPAFPVEAPARPLETPATSRSRSMPMVNRMHLPQYSSAGTVGGNPPPTGCIYRRPDGILVRLVCKDCSRTTFGSAQGFINHCRISHGREFTSHDNAAQCCGDELSEADQDDIGLGAIKHRRHMQMSSSGPPLFSPDSFPPPTPSSTPVVARPSSVDDGAAPATVDYGTKSFPWNYTASSTFMDQPITPPNEAQLDKDKIPRQLATVSEVLENASPTPAASVSQIQTPTSPKTSEPTEAIPAEAPAVEPEAKTATTQTTQTQAISIANTISMAINNAPPPATRHLSNLLKRKKVNVDLDHMAAESVKRDPRGHLFPGEEDVSDEEEESRLPSVAKFKKLAAGHRGRPLGSGIRILANFH